MSGLKWVLGYFRRYPFKSIFVIIAAIGEVILYSYPITITSQVIGLALEGSDFSQMTSKIIFLLILAFLQALLFFTLSFTNEILAHRITTDMTQDFFETLQYRSLTYHDSKDVGEIMARATGDTRTINIALSPGVRFLLSIIVVWVLNISIIFRIDLWLGVIGIVVLIIFLYSTYKYSSNLVSYSLKSREAFGDLSKDTDNYITGIREIKGFVSEIWAKRKFAKQSQNVYKKEIKEGNVAAWFYPMFVVTFYAGLITVLTLYYAFVKDSVSIPDVIQVAGYISLLMGISQEISWAVEFLVRANAAANRISNTINENDPAKINPGKLSFDNCNAKITFDKVSFRYRSDLPYAIEDVSFNVKENQTIAIVGGPGSGKSTITKLIQRLYLPTKGTIYLGEKPIQDYTNNSLRKNIATVEQDVFLFNKSVKDNIRFGKPEASDEEVIHVAKLAQAHDFIMQLPNQYDNLIGEKGVKLSGGQAQRLSIARALLVNPRILIMDDGASALDARTEIKVQEAIQSILRTHTTIITTHRLSIISQADYVLILDKGKLVGIGPHEELIRTNPYYRRLFEHHYELPPRISSKN